MIEDEPKKEIIRIEFDEKLVERAFESGCSIRQVCAFCKVSLSTLRQWAMDCYALTIEEVREMLSDRGKAAYNMLVYRKLVLEEDIDYHRIYGKLMAEVGKEVVDVQGNANDIVQYEIQIPDNGRCER